MAKVIEIKGLNGEEYEAIKKAAKEEIPFTVNIRYWKRQYAFGAIDIRPKAPRGSNDPFYKWTKEQFQIVLDFLIRHGLVYSAGNSNINNTKGKDDFSKFDMQYLIWSQGFCFMRRAVNEQPDAIEPKQETIKPVRNEIEETVESVIDYATSIMSDEFTATAKRPETKEEKETFAQKIGEYISNNGYDLVSILEYVKTNYGTYKYLLEALIFLSTPVKEEVNTITQIESNGSKWNSEQPDTIEDLLHALDTYALDPTFEDYGNFIADFEPLKVTEDNKHFIGCKSFFGNFANYSHVFRIITNDSVLIDRLTKAIRANQYREDYKEIRNERLIQKRMDEIALNMFNNKEIGLKEKYEYSSKSTEKGKALYEQVKAELFPQVDEVQPEELEQQILKCPQVYFPVPYQIDWGTNTRGQGKRRGGMVMGAMADPPRGVKTYQNRYANLPDYEAIKQDVHRLDAFQEFRYLKARDYGLNHVEAFLFCMSMDSLQKYWRKQRTEQSA